MQLVPYANMSNTKAKMTWKCGSYFVNDDDDDTDKQLIFQNGKLGRFVVI